MVANTHNLQNKLETGSFSGSGKAFKTSAGYLLGWGTSVPTDANVWSPGARYIKTDGSAGTVLYVNEGTKASPSFQAVSALTAAQEALIGATAGVSTASKALILDASGHLASGPIIMDDMAAGAGMSGAAALQHSVVKVGGIYHTHIVVDLQGLNAGATAGDIIGTDPGAASCHIGQITAAKNGAIFGGRMFCTEAPATGDNDIDLYSADESTGAEDAAIGSLTNGVQLCNSGALSLGSIVGISGTPVADQYLYLVGQVGADATYTAGKLHIELWGV